jgi:hypothetical protein
MQGSSLAGRAGAAKALVESSDLPKTLDFISPWPLKTDLEVFSWS